MTISDTLIKKVLQAREKMNQYGIVIARDKDTDKVLGFKFAYKTNCHFDLERIFGKERLKRDFISKEISV